MKVTQRTHNFLERPDYQQQHQVMGDLTDLAIKAKKKMEIQEH